MCGIAGKLTFNGDAVPRQLVIDMCEALVHRGPDDAGYYVNGNYAMGQRRLSIIDLDKRSTPPLSNEDNTLYIVFNGEIYNYRELRTQLISAGHTFRTHSDTEVILHLYEEYREKCLDRLRGMFAFVIWDNKNKRIFAARDRLGKKPFFYYHSKKAFIFGSELNALLQDDCIERSPNLMAIDSYLSQQCVPSPLTAFENICKLPPAHYLLCGSDGTLHTKQYWYMPGDKDNTFDIIRVQEEVENKIIESVKYRMIADVPVGAFLSGGIDSGLLVAAMAKHSAVKIKTFTVGFEDDSYNEMPFAKMVSERYDTDHHEIIVKPAIIDILPNLIRNYGEPFADSSAIPTFYVAKEAARHVKVAISGDGGDESFAGYIHYQKVLGLSRIDQTPINVLKNALAVLTKQYKGKCVSNRLARVVRMIRLLSNELPERYTAYLSMFKMEEKNCLYSNELKTVMKKTALMPGDENDAIQDKLDWMILHDLRHYLGDCLLTKVDIAAMANSIEIRSPLLDHELVELAGKIPSHYKINNNTGKIILRTLAKKYLPPEIIYKKKTGFAIPLAKWLGTDFASMMREVLLSPRALNRGLFSAGYLVKMVDEHVTGARDWSNRLWALLMLELWYQMYIDRNHV